MEPGHRADAERLRALEPGSEMGGDRRGERSATLIVVSTKSTEVNTMVNEHMTPIKEVGRKLRVLGGW